MKCPRCGQEIKDTKCKNCGFDIKKDTTILLLGEGNLYCQVATKQNNEFVTAPIIESIESLSADMERFSDEKKESKMKDRPASKNILFVRPDDNKNANQNHKDDSNQNRKIKQTSVWDPFFQTLRIELVIVACVCLVLVFIFFSVDNENADNSEKNAPIEQTENTEEEVTDEKVSDVSIFETYSGRLSTVSMDTIAITNDGTVYFTPMVGKHYQDMTDEDLSEIQNEIAQWENVSSISWSDKYNCVAAVTEEGAVKVACTSNFSQYYDDVKNWKNIVQIVQNDSAIIGIDKEGNVYVAGRYTEDSWVVQELRKWKDIKEMAASAKDNVIVGLKSDGTIISTEEYTTWRDVYGFDTSSWENVTHIYINGRSVYGLLDNGRVLASGDNGSGQCNVEEWEDIIKIVPGFLYVLGLKSDGTVIATGDNGDGQCNVKDWTEIVDISATAELHKSPHTISLKSGEELVLMGISAHSCGLKANGTVVATGSNNNGECDVDSWQDIVAISAGPAHTVGLKKDGTLVSAGYNGLGEREIEDWRLW